ncbi:hypothetical protein [Serratia proteamaculans]|uniref:hypothetical protein n=1 Tax=Serratia proteamaculans TaxID=28151 RepID=UPI00101F6331|nr:hypothetical protein [Serratia proteamaculans]RYM50082.1 hypothetical protein BSQ96_18830 [Serratia proteamaculans]
MKEFFKVLGVIGVAGVFGLLLCLLVLAAAAESREWEKFKSDHNCRITGKMDGDVNVGYGVSTSGNAVTTINTTPDKTGWTCDDGVTYWK